MYDIATGEIRKRWNMMVKKTPRESFQAMLDKTIEERPDLFDFDSDIPEPQWLIDARENGDIVEINPVSPAMARKAKRGGR